MMKKLSILLLIISITLFISCEQQEQQETSKPVSFFITVSPQTVEQQENFTIYGYLKNNGDSNMRNVNLEIIGLDHNYFSVPSSQNFQIIQKNQKPEIISQDFTFSNLRYNKDIYSSNTFNFYLKASYTYDTAVKSLLCVSLNDPSCKGNFRENIVTKGFITATPRTSVTETKDKYVIYVTYEFSVAHGVKIDKVRITSFSIAAPSALVSAYKNILIIGKNVKTLNNIQNIANNEVELANDKMIIQWMMEINKNNLALVDTDIPIYINLTYTVVEYYPLSVTVIPKR